jgi:acylphosphatase
MPIKKINAVISGRVQGVGFRYYILEKAEMIGISGWVSNLPDGDVKTEAIGDENQISDFLQYLRKGPSGARIERVDYTIEDVALNEFSGFDIKYW